MLVSAEYKIYRIATNYTNNCAKLYDINPHKREMCYTFWGDKDNFIAFHCQASVSGLRVQLRDNVPV